MSLCLGLYFVWKVESRDIPAPPFPYERLLSEQIEDHDSPEDPMLSYFLNPFVRTQKNKKAPLLRVKLSSIIIVGDQKICLLNGKPYRLGDSFFSAKIVNIDKDHVVLALGDKKRIKVKVGEEVYL